MLRFIGAVFAGFALWSVLWLAYNAGLRQLALLQAEPGASMAETTPLLLLLLGSVAISLAAGYVAAAILPARLPVLVLGLLLLAAGILAQRQYWAIMPLWYHVAFLGLLIPVCLAGAWLRGVSAG